MNACVITTINKPTEAIEVLSRKFPGGLIVVGDRKTPVGWHHQGATFLSRRAQARSPFKTASRMLDNHYARKNLGYLRAMRAGAALIYDTDDDNVPNESWKIRSLGCAGSIQLTLGWCNVYHHLGQKNVWPRGFPLQQVPIQGTWTRRDEAVFSPVQQGMADGNPDVDAIWRMIMPRSVRFSKKLSVTLNSQYTWCPFNSQTTWWWPKAYPLMYLPTYVTFRMTDIWRSFVAQRCLGAMGETVTFHSPAEVFQDRNPHNLLRDFESEVPGYLNNAAIMDILVDLPLIGDPCDDLLVCYKALVRAKLVPKAELQAVKAWVADIGTLRAVKTCISSA